MPTRHTGPAMDLANMRALGVGAVMWSARLRVALRSICGLDGVGRSEGADAAPADCRAGWMI